MTSTVERPASPDPAPEPERTASASAGWLPFLCIVVAIVLVAGSAISWIASPNWGKHNPIANARDVGNVPASAVRATAGSRVAPVALDLAPNRIVIQKLGTDASVFAIDTENGTLEPPIDPRQVGWWRGGAKPGATTGTAVITGHINYAGVTGAMAHIGTLDPGDKVWIYGQRNGKQTRMEFTITGVRTYIKKTLPYTEIFNQNVDGRLALITCGGPFDASTGNYLDNIVAYAVPA